MRAQFQQVVDKSIESVFPFLADPRNRPRWQSSLRTVEMLSEGEPRVGMAWRERPGGLIRFDMRISALEPQALWAEHLEGAGISGEIALRFTRENDATRVTVDISLQLPSPLRIAAPLIRSLLVRAVRHDLARVARLV